MKKRICNDCYKLFNIKELTEYYISTGISLLFCDKCEQDWVRKSGSTLGRVRDEYHGEFKLQQQG